MNAASTLSDEERIRRWRLLLGGAESDGTGIALSADDLRMDACLAALYDAQLEDERKGKTRQGALSASAPKVTRWLGDIRSYFPASVVKILQHDAFERLNIQRMLLEPEFLQTVEADVHLLSTLLSLQTVMPNKTKDTARIVVRKVVEELMKKLANHTRQAITGSLSRSQKNKNPRHNEIDWQRTLKANLKNYQTQYRTVIVEKRIGYGRKRSSLKDIILCVDQSGSMAASVVYASVFAAVLASIPALRTSLVFFDTAVVDLSEKLHDPVEVLFGANLGGGTDINRALNYCQSLVRRPSDTTLVLISDLYEGGDSREMIKCMARLVSSGIKVITLLSLNDDGAPVYDHANAATLASMDVPAFACTPDLFPDLMAATLCGRQIQQWAAENDLLVCRQR